ncbi:MAG TPA: hypothetical protein VFB62_04100, partial [Polyangiaceae bacterium]|nr:hypothetical protein [Polyangiaceae bacterium]
MKNQLGWLRGFPSTGRRWVCVPAPGSERPIEEIVVGPSHLQSATRALHTLLGEHRGALAELVDDVGRWQQGTKAMLEALSRGASIDVVALLGSVQARNARRLASADARVLPLMKALAFVHLREPRELKKCFDCVEEAATALAGILENLPLAVRLVDAAREDGAARFMPLFERLGDARIHDVALGIAGSGAIVVTERRKGRMRAWPDKGQANLGPALVDLATRLPTWDAPRRRRTLSLWSLVDPALVVDGWAKLWTRYDTLVREAEELLPHARVPRASRRLTALQRAFKRLDDTKPSALDGASLVRAVEAIGAAPAATCTAVARVLARLPVQRGRRLLRTHMLFVYEHVLHDAAHTELCAREFERLVSEVGDVDV